MNFNEFYRRRLQKSNESISGFSLENPELYRRRLSQHSNFSRLDSSEVKRKWKSLDKQFNKDILRLERSLGGMETGEKSFASEWISKLKAHPPNLSEALARNNIVDYLLRNNNLNIFNTKPFNTPSALNSLSKFQSVMPMSAMSLKQKSVNELMNNSFDKGDFINKLPVPRDGAFFILHLSPNFENSEIFKY